MPDGDFMTASRLLCWLVCILAWTTALLPLRIAERLLVLYVTHGGGWLLATRVALPTLLWAAAYVVSGMLYLKVSALRVPFLGLSALLAITGLIATVGHLHQLSTLNVWRNMLAEGFWEACACALIACTALTQQIVQKGNQTR